MTATSSWANVLLSAKKARIKITLRAMDQQVSQFPQLQVQSESQVVPKYRS